MFFKNVLFDFSWPILQPTRVLRLEIPFRVYFHFSIEGSVLSIMSVLFRRNKNKIQDKRAAMLLTKKNICNVKLVVQPNIFFLL